MSRKLNFSAGPAILPESVLLEASKGVLEIDGSGMSILELSHRGKEYEKIHFETRDALLRVLGLDPNVYSVLFLGGGASTQFATIPMNFLGKDETADYIHTGEWAIKAIKEAQRFGNVHVAGSSEPDKHSKIPTELNFSSNPKYVHVTSNNTIEGTQWSEFPDVGDIPLIVDASSDIMCKSVDYSKFSLIYAGAQKNAGPAGVTLVIAKKEFLGTGTSDIPTIFSYKTHDKADSLYNTPPAFSIYVVGLVLKWIEEQGGVAAVEEVNRHKAELIYSVLDEFPDIYDPAVTVKQDRSLMNITFRLFNTDRDKDFLAGAAERNMDGLKGHRAVGGFRASIYNAFPVYGCEAFAQYLRDFARY